MEAKSKMSPGLRNAYKFMKKLVKERDLGPFDKTKGIIRLLDKDDGYRGYVINNIFYFWDSVCEDVDIMSLTKAEDVPLAFDPATLIVDDRYKMNLEDFRIIIDERQLYWLTIGFVNLVMMEIDAPKLKEIIRNLTDDDFLGILPHDPYPIRVYTCSNWCGNLKCESLHWLKDTKLCIKFDLDYLYPTLLNAGIVQIHISLIPNSVKIS